MEIVIHFKNKQKKIFSLSGVKSPDEVKENIYMALNETASRYASFTFNQKHIIWFNKDNVDYIEIIME